MIYLGQYTELFLLVEALEMHGSARSHSAYATAVDVQSQLPALEVSKHLTAADYAAFLPLLSEVEESIGVPFTEEELWFVHGVVDWYMKEVRPDCWVARNMYQQVTMGVAALDRPPY